MGLILKIFQPDSEKLKAIYGDSRGSFEGLESRRKWYPDQFVQLVDMVALKMDFYTEVLSVDLTDEANAFFASVREQFESGYAMSALGALFRIGNLNVDLMAKHFGYKGYSLSVGHVVVFIEGNHAHFFYCDNVGWEIIRTTQVPGMDDFDNYGLRKAVEA